MEGLHRIDSGIPDHHWDSVIVFDCRWLGARIYQLRNHQSLQRSQPRNQLADLHSRDGCWCCTSFLCEAEWAKLANALPATPALADQASSGSGPSEREGVVPDLTSRCWKTGMRNASASHR